MKMEDLLTAADEMREQQQNQQQSQQHAHSHAHSQSAPPTPSSLDPSRSSTDPSPLSSSAVPSCKTPGCVVCLKGPPPSFEKGTPIWAQILHLVLYALTESAKVTVMGSPKMKVKRYFHLRDDIYEYISIHWDVICRRERIKNWRHTIGMTLSHYQNLFQNGYHIYQNTGYWSMKDNVPSPYVIDTMIGGPEQSPGKKRKYTHSKNQPASDKDDKATESQAENDQPTHSEAENSKSTLDPYFKGPNTNSSTSHHHHNNNHNNNNSNNNNTTTTTTTSSSLALVSVDPDSNHSHGYNTNHAHNLYVNGGSRLRTETTSMSLQPPSQREPYQHSLPPVMPSGSYLNNNGTSIKFDEMKNEIDRFKSEMSSLQSEIDSLQAQLQVKKAEEHLLKFLQEGISSFRDKIKHRIELLKTEMINNHSEHQQQIHNMASELFVDKGPMIHLHLPQYKFIHHQHQQQPHFF